MNKVKVKEICSECGNSVEFGSGRFVNRIPDFNTPAERKMIGRPYPKGDFICAECEWEFSKSNPLRS